MQVPLLGEDGSVIDRCRVHVHFGDWREIVSLWPRPFALITDPPYGIDADTGFDRGGRTSRSECLGDKDTRERDEALAVPGREAAAIFGPGGLKLLEVPPWGWPGAEGPKVVLPWTKGHYVGLGDVSFPWGSCWESVAFYGKAWQGKRSARLDFPPGFVGAQHHPHEKPVALLVHLLSKIPAELPVVDPFLGGGSTAVACALLGRECWGAEVDPDYFDVITGRLRAEAGAVPVMV